MTQACSISRSNLTLVAGSRCDSNDSRVRLAIFSCHPDVSACSVFQRLVRVLPPGFGSVPPRTGTSPEPPDVPPSKPAQIEVLLAWKCPLHNDSLADSPSTTGNEINTQARRNAKEKQAPSSDVIMLIIFCVSAVCSSVAGGMNSFCCVKYSTTTITGSTLKYGPSQPVPRP